MSVKMSVDVESNLDETIEARDQALEMAFEMIGSMAETYAKAKCPVGTQESTGIKGYIGGTLRGSITYATEKTGSKPQPPATAAQGTPLATPEKNTVYIGTNVEYAPYVEMGTSKMKAQPFLGPAIKNNMGEYKRIMEMFLGNA